MREWLRNTLKVGKTLAVPYGGIDYDQLRRLLRCFQQPLRLLSLFLALVPILSLSLSSVSVLAGAHPSRADRTYCHPRCGPRSTRATRSRIPLRVGKIDERSEVPGTFERVGLLFFFSLSFFLIISIDDFTYQRESEIYARFLPSSLLRRKQAHVFVCI